MPEKTEIALAYETASGDLRRCYSKEGIVAGLRNFNEYWARDSFFASLGANSLGDFEISKKNLSLFLSLQRKDGLLPGRVSRKLRPSYKPMLFSPCIDSQALFFMALLDYVQKSGDKKFLLDNFEKAKKAMARLKAGDRNNDCLIEEGLFANWMDTVLKFGNVLYTNCCYCRALSDFSKLCAIAGKKELAEEHSLLAEQVREKINQRFWNGGYYNDWFDFWEQDFFCSDGNVLACLWEIADSVQAQMVQNYIKQRQLAKVPMKTNFPPYPPWRIALPLLPFRAYHYHNGFSWPWIGCLNAIAMKKMGLSKEAEQQLRAIAGIINTASASPEILDEKGIPANSFMLKCEKPFAWTAGLFVLAVHEIKKSAVQNS